MFNIEKKLKSRFNKERMELLIKQLAYLRQDKAENSYIRLRVREDIETFFLGRFYKHIFSTNQKKEKAIRKLLKKHTYNNVIDFGCGKLPYPSKNDFNTFLYEFYDLIVPYLYKDPALLKIYFGEGPYEYKRVVLKQNDVVIDAGANMGVFSAFASNKGCSVYAFEPVDTTREQYLEKTANLNDNITIVPFGLSDKCEKLVFNVSNTTNIGAFGRIKSGEDIRALKTVEINAITLDSFVDKNNISKVDFIKADIEGSERYMLQGAKHVLKDFAPKIAICTYHLPDDPQVLRELILSANDKYIIEEKWKKMFAYVPRTSKKTTSV